MPAPGEQHINPTGKAITNPFEDMKPRISEYTAQEIITLQSRLEKQLGPEYISSRAGPSGQKVHYLAAEKCIQLANDVFGFNGWSSQIMDVQVDFVDENPNTFKVSLGLSVIVRVTLRDGTFHEDVGYGHMENCKGKAAAFEKAKKEGTTDGLKRALRNFGNVLGNCIYDKEYLARVTKVKAQPTKWDVDKLHRHSTYAPPKKEPEPDPKLGGKPQIETAVASLSTEDTFEDEFGEFDEVDFNIADPESHPDEVALPVQGAGSHHLNNVKNSNGPTSGTASSRNTSTINRQQPAATPLRPPAGNNYPLPQPQTPQSRFATSNSGAGGAGQSMRPPPDPGCQLRSIPPPQSIPVAGRVLNQPSRIGRPPPESPGPVGKSSDDNDMAALPPQGAGFFSARAAPMLPEGQIPEGPISSTVNTAMPFNLHADSPSIRKTPGVDHKSSKPLTRDLKHVPGSTQPTSVIPPSPRAPSNIVNPQLDTTRRIGQPGSPSPGMNRGQYKPPTMKRPIDGSSGGLNAGRVPLNDLSANGPIGGDVGGDIKRQKLDG